MQDAGSHRDGPPTGRRRDATAWILGGGVGVALLVVVDAVRALLRSPTGPMAGGLAVFLVSALAAGCILFVPLLLLRGEIARLTRATRIGLATRGALDGAFLWFLAIYIEDPLSIGSGLRALALVVAVVCGALLAILTRGRDRLARALAVVGIVGAVSYSEIGLSWRKMDWTRVALDAAVVAMASVVLRPFTLRAGRTQVLALAILVCVLGVSAGPLSRASEGGRRLLHQWSSHGRGWMSVFERLADRDGDGAASLWGARDCDPDDGEVYPGATERPGDGKDGNCEGGDGIRPSPAAAARRGRGAAAGRDVLLLSVDGLRWDVASELDAVRDALGPHAEFTRAVSPSPRTMHSLPATLRGRPFRQVRFDHLVEFRRGGPWRDRSPSIGDVLARRGYGTIAVPTHRYLAPETGILRGFRPGLGKSWAVVRRGRDTPAVPHPIVPADEALDLVREMARSSTEPVLAWVHLMETHDPYRWEGVGAGPPTIQGLRHSARDFADRAARFLADFERIRGKRPVVAVFGDHGEEFGEHGERFHSTSVYAEQVRVPMLVASPGLPAGEYDAPVSTSALPATILDLLGIDVPESMTVRSLLPCLTGEADWPVLAVSELRFRGRTRVGYTGRRYRLVYDPTYRTEELFDSEVDPLEGRDLSGARRDVLRRMRRLARAWDERH